MWVLQQPLSSELKLNSSVLEKQNLLCVQALYGAVALPVNSNLEYFEAYFSSLLERRCLPDQLLRVEIVDYVGSDAEV